MTLNKINKNMIDPNFVQEVQDTTNKIGNLSELKTTNKTDIVKSVNEVTSKLVETEMLEDVVVNVSSYGALGIGVDDTVPILAAISDLLTKPGKRVLHFPGTKYIMTKKFPRISKDIMITGRNEFGTTIEYQATTDGFFIENNSHEKFQMKDITIHIIRQPSTLKVGGIEAYRDNRSSWGKRVELENVKVLGYTTTGVKVYAPFMNIFKKVTINSNKMLMKNPTNSRLPHPDHQSVGLELTAYESGITDTFGNVNSFDTCFFQNNKYGVKISSVSAVTFNSCTFEPNFINVYAISPTANSATAQIVINGSWFEDYTGACHPDMGAYVFYEFNETTGDLTQPLTKKAELSITNTRIHFSCPIDKRMNGAFTNITPTFIYSDKSFLDLDSENFIIWKATSLDGSYVTFGTKKNTLRNLTEFKQGTNLLANNSTNGKEQEELYFYQVTNSNTDKNAIYTFEIPISIDLANFVEIKIDAHLRASGGYRVWCRGMQYGITTKNVEVLDDTGNHATSIDANNKGMKLTYNGTTKKTTLSFQASGSDRVSVNVKVTTRTSL